PVAGPPAVFCGRIGGRGYVRAGRHGKSREEVLFAGAQQILAGTTLRVVKRERHDVEHPASTEYTTASLHTLMQASQAETCLQRQPHSN
ncbi:unnamed protein product, partial [Phaeothamnion confervicola]